MNGCYDYLLKRLTSSAACTIVPLTFLLWVFWQESQNKRRKEGQPRFVFVLTTMTVRSLLFFESCHLSYIGSSLFMLDCISTCLRPWSQASVKRTRQNQTVLWPFWCTLAKFCRQKVVYSVVMKHQNHFKTKHLSVGQCGEFALQTWTRVESAL